MALTQLRRAALLSFAACPLFSSGIAAQIPDSLVSYVSASYERSHFFEGPDPWQYASLAFERKARVGSIIARGNFAHRFATDGFQGEVDAYPRLTKKLYAYLNVGYSRSSIFPRWRSGAEVFASLPSAWEASVGFRQLRFDGTPTTLFTGAVGKYSGNWWTSVRPYIRRKDTGLAASAGITVRRYTTDADNYVGATISGGSAPTERIDPSQLAKTGSWSLGIHGSRTIKPLVTGTWSVGYDHETLASRAVRRRLDTGIGIRLGR